MCIGQTMFNFAALLRAPPAALLLGFGGLIPFFGLTLATLLNIQVLGREPTQLLADYGATILAFVGALQWGYAITGSAGDWFRYAWGVIPALLAWAALQLAIPTGLVTLAGGLLLALIVDVALPAKEQAAWVLPLRTVLSLTGAASLVLASFSV